MGRQQQGMWLSSSETGDGVLATFVLARSNLVFWEEACVNGHQIGLREVFS